MKTPLVLLSGLLSNELLWQHQIDHLSDVADIQVICSSGNTPEKMVRAILDQAYPKFALAGHSMGGWLCLEVMRHAPSRVSRLCLLNTTTRPDSEDKKIQRQKMISKAEKGHFQEIVEDLVEHFVFRPSAKEGVKKMFLQVGKEAFIHQQQAMLNRQEVMSLLPLITCPTLVIHAMQDKNFSLEEHQELVREIKGAKLATVDGSGHMSPIESPQAITSLLRSWLTFS